MNASTGFLVNAKDVMTYVLYIYIYTYVCVYEWISLHVCIMFVHLYVNEYTIADANIIIVQHIYYSLM